MHPDLKITKEGWWVVKDDTHLSKWIEETGLIDHGQNIEHHYRKYFGPGDVVIDVGASLGDHTVPYARIVGEKGTVIAFEPGELQFECLLQNTGQFTQVMVLPVALGDKTGQGSLVRDANIGASYVDDSKQGFFIERLDMFEFQDVKFIKIDVEGWELRVLKGGEDTIKRCRPIIMFEVSGHYKRIGATEGEVFAWLKARDYIIQAPGGVQYDAVAYPKEKFVEKPSNPLFGSLA